MPSARIVAALCLLGAAVLGACGDDDDLADRRADQARRAALDAGLDQAVADFLALLAQGDTASYSVRFPGPDEGTELVVRSRPPDRRVDVERDGEVVEVRQVVDGEAFTCTPQDGDAWSCERTDALVEPPGLFSAEALERLSAGLANRRDDYDFSVDDREVAGIDARCLVTRLREGRGGPESGEEGTICASPEGVIVLVDQGSQRIEAIDYTTDVDARSLRRVDEP